MKIVYVYLLGFVFIIVAIVSFLGRSRGMDSIHNPVPSLNLTVSPYSSPAPESNKAEAKLEENIKNKIKSNLDNRTPALLVELMTDKVGFTRYGTSCCGVLTKSQIPPQFALISEANGPWNIGESSIAAKLKLKQPSRFDKKIIATSVNSYAIAFHLTATDLIDDIIIVENTDSVK